MNLQYARPDLTELALRVYDRVVHPEFFDCLGMVVLGCGPWKLLLRVHTAGHLWTLTRERFAFTEAITRDGQPLPDQRCLLEHKIRNGRSRRLDLPHGVHYDLGCQLETLEWDLFLRVNDELRADCSRAELAYTFPGQNRLHPQPLSLITASLDRSGLVVHTYHTFPEACTILKTQSLLEWG
ncbi:MAG: hypothetical protein KatS3mg113_0030 [Planctomycetaceae bacterium]|nr:MAG: hypothetical protein KatS3mg113_0030 [Planctomycetaceae bacterium]